MALSKSLSFALQLALLSRLCLCDFFEAPTSAPKVCSGDDCTVREATAVLNGKKISSPASLAHTGTSQARRRQARRRRRTISGGSGGESEGSNEDEGARRRSGKGLKSERIGKGLTGSNEAETDDGHSSVRSGKGGKGGKGGEESFSGDGKDPSPSPAGGSGSSGSSAGRTPGTAYAPGQVEYSDRSCPGANSVNACCIECKGCDFKGNGECVGRKQGECVFEDSATVQVKCSVVGKSGSSIPCYTKRKVYLKGICVEHATKKQYPWFCSHDALGNGGGGKNKSQLGGKGGKGGKGR